MSAIITRELQMKTQKEVGFKHYFTVKQCAEYLCCSERTIWRCLERGILKYQSFGTGEIRPKKLIHIDSINRMLGSNTPVSLQGREYENLKMAG